jgi:cysteine desulfurase
VQATVADGLVRARRLSASQETPGQKFGRRSRSVRWTVVLAYLDHAAGGPVHPEAASAMRPWLAERFGNPSGAHQVARAARAAIEEARDVVSEFLGVEPGGVTFTSGGTEADNLAVLGTTAARPGPIVVGATEHPAVMEAAMATGCEVRIAAVGADGVVDLASLDRLLDATVALVSIQLVNHETGVIQPWARLAGRVRRRAPAATLHTDAVQAASWFDLRTEAAGAHLVSISGHKIGGPQGIGILAARGRPPLQAVLRGGGQERELRSGTQNVAAIVGVGAALRAVARDRDRTAARVGQLRDDLASRIRAATPDCTVTAADSPTAPGHLHLRFAGVESEALLVLLDESGVCASAGAACASGAMEPSPVLLAMGVEKHDALSSLRLTLGPTTTEQEIDLAASAVPAAVARLRAGAA